MINFVIPFTGLCLLTAIHPISQVYAGQKVSLGLDGKTWRGEFTQKQVDGFNGLDDSQKQQILKLLKDEEKLKRLNSLLKLKEKYPSIKKASPGFAQTRKKLTQLPQQQGTPLEQQSLPSEKETQEKINNLLTRIDLAVNKPLSDCEGTQPVISAAPKGSEQPPTAHQESQDRCPNGETQISEQLRLIQSKSPQTETDVQSQGMLTWLATIPQTCVRSYDDLTEFTHSFCATQRVCEFPQVSALFTSLTQNYQKWISQARLNKKVNKQKIPVPAGSQLSATSAEVLITPTGSIFLNYESIPMGDGAYKIASTRISLLKEGGHFRITPVVALTANRGISSSKWKEIVKHVMDINVKINEYSKKHRNKKVEGLVQTEVIQTDSPVLIQPKFDRDLTNANMNSEKRVAIFEKIATGLSHFHSMGLVHGDIKPENILVSMDGSQVAITDFDLSYDAKKKVNRKLAGTLDYIPLEVLNDKMRAELTEAKKKKQDVYAFGVTALYSLRNAFLDRDPPRSLQDFCRPVCDMKAANKFYDAAVSWADALCKKGPLQDSNCALARIAADSVKSNPNDRPTSEQLRKRLHGLTVKEQGNTPVLPLVRE